MSAAAGIALATLAIAGLVKPCAAAVTRHAASVADSKKPEPRRARLDEVNARLCVEATVLRAQRVVLEVELEVDSKPCRRPDGVTSGGSGGPEAAGTGTRARPAC